MLRLLTPDTSHEEIESSLLQSIYRAYLEGETLKLVIKHLVMLLLYGICRKEWNYLKKRLELRVFSFSGKKRLRNVIKHIINTNFNLFPIQDSVLQNDRTFALLFNSAIQELRDCQLVITKVEEGHNRTNRFEVNVYTISEIGMQYFEREILPLMPDRILEILRSIREGAEQAVLLSPNREFLDKEKFS